MIIVRKDYSWGFYFFIYDIDKESGIANYIGNKLKSNAFIFNHYIKLAIRKLHYGIALLFIT